MKTLILMRHASASSHETSDALRSLSDKGIQEALETAKFLKTFNIDKILCSSALRTVETFNIIQGELQVNLTDIKPELYNTSETELLEHIVSQRDKVDTLLVIAHNPSVTQLSIFLTENNEDQDYELKEVLLPAQAVVLQFSGTQWNDLQTSSVTISRIFTPLQI